jgi:hypothetical protein
MGDECLPELMSSKGWWRCCRGQPSHRAIRKVCRPSAFSKKHTIKLDHDGARILNSRRDELKVRLSELIAGMSVPVRSISAVDPEVGYTPEIIAATLVIGTLVGTLLYWHP